jgi:dienelactone hydrolase
LRLPALLVLLLLALPAAADTVHLKGGKKLHGRVIATEPEVVVNIYNSTNLQMKLGVERVPASRVKKIVRTIPAPRREFQARMRKAEDAASLLEIAAWCAEKKLSEERGYALELALRLEPGNEDARKALGRKAPKGDWGEQVALARRFLSAADAEKRAAALLAIRKDRHFPFSERYLQRALRSAGQAKGYQRDRPVALRADKLLPNARYTLVVPANYDPLVPTPLVIGLHGGGAGGADGKLVVGSGHSAMNFYRGQVEGRGWICACPTALRAGWGSRPNDDLVDALLDELCALYNIDENRIYLVGHSMGGGGTWVQGARLPETWAAIAPAASFGVTGIDRFKKTGTGFYVYHSDDDPRTRVGGVRPRMQNLPGSGIDFVYTELPGRGHSFPAEVVRDIFRFFEVRTLSIGRGRPKPAARPQSSFQRKLSRDEKKYLPALETAGGGATDDKLGKLIKRLATGGGVAEQVVDDLAKHPSPKVDGAVAKQMLKGDATADVRRFGAVILGKRKAKQQIKNLGRVLLIENDATAQGAILDAFEAIGDPAAGDQLVKFLKKRQAYLKERARGTQLDHSDWSAILPPMARACSLVGSFKPKGGAATIAKVVLEGVFLAGTTVIYDIQNQRPLPVGQALARGACSALAQLKDPVAQEALDRMAAVPTSQVTVKRLRGPVAIMGDWAKDPRIAGYVREARLALK